MVKRKQMIIAVLVSVVLVGIAWLLSYEKPLRLEEDRYFTADPSTWIEEYTKTEKSEDREINIFKATEAKATMDVFQEDYRTDGKLYSFFYSGLFRGSGFDNVFVDGAFFDLAENLSYEEKNSLVPSYVKMELGPGMDPTNSVIEGFILAKEENGQFVFYIFVDEDWKQQLEFTNILWGDAFADIDSLNIKQFDFSKVQDGIYIDKIDKGVDWFYESPVKGGIIVGEINIPILQEIADYQFPNVTLMMVR